MIITKTPLRISLFGGGADFPNHYGKHGGAVLSTAIDKYIWVTVAPRFDNKIVAAYSQYEAVANIGELRHDLIREALGMVYWREIAINGKQPPGLEIHTLADIPTRGCGLGSSSTVTIGVLNALYTMENDRHNPEFLANRAIDIELTRLQKPIGIQDQIAAAWGGLNLIEFNLPGLPDTHNRVIPQRLDVPQETIDVLDNNLLLFFTGQTRQSVVILKEQSEKNKDNSSILNEMSDMARFGAEALRAGRVDDIGRMLHVAWGHKKQLAGGITHVEIDKMYDVGLAAGALGGKICGAGGGGFMLFYCPTGTHARVRAAMFELDKRELKFTFEKSGSRVVFDDR